MKRTILIAIAALLVVVASALLVAHDIPLAFTPSLPATLGLEWFFLPTVLLFLLGISLLILFFRPIANTHRRNRELLLLSLLSFCLTVCVLFSTPLPSFFSNSLSSQLSTLSALSAVTLFLVFFSGHIDHFSILVRILQLMQGSSIALYMVCSLTNAPILTHSLFLAQTLSLIALFIIFFISLVECHHGNRFCQVLCLTSLLTAVIFLFINGIPWLIAQHTSDALAVMYPLSTMPPPSTLINWNPIYLTSGLSVITTYVVSSFLQCRSQIELLSERVRLTQASYDALRTQSEEVMRIRHDMTHHLNVLYRLLEQKSLEQACAYLRNLLGQHQNILPIVRCGHPLLDILFNGKISAAIDLGISVKIVHAEAPPTLPLSDIELTSLIMNVLSNAIEAASACPTGHRFLTLNLYTKHQFFIFCCTNSRTNAQTSVSKSTGNAIPRHGYGIKIITDIVKRHGGLMQTEQDEKQFRLTLSLPLSGQMGMDIK